MPKQANTQQTYQLIYAAVRRIPPGRVSSYGRIARMLGQPRWARLVGYAMRACDDAGVPCHRVLQWDGTLAPSFGVGGPEWQAEQLRQEGVAVVDGRVDMGVYAWEGEAEEQPREN